MKKKIILDIIMSLIMFFLMNLFLTGVLTHEVLGILIFFLFMYHIFLNIKWIKTISVNLFNDTIKSKFKLIYILDVIIFLLMILNIITGIMISNYLLTFISTTETELVSSWHRFFAYWLLIFLFIHVVLHWSMIRNFIKIKRNSITEKIIIGVTLVIIIITFFKINILEKLTIPKKQLSSVVDSYDNKEKDNFISDDKEDKNNILENENDNIEDNDDMVSIEEYLSKLFCTGCSRHCPLTHPSCSKGIRRQKQEVQAYNEMYGTNESYNG